MSISESCIKGSPLSPNRTSTVHFADFPAEGHDSSRSSSADDEANQEQAIVSPIRRESTFAVAPIDTFVNDQETEEETVAEKLAQQLRRNDGLHMILHLAPSMRKGKAGKGGKIQQLLQRKGSMASGSASPELMSPLVRRMSSIVADDTIGSKRTTRKKSRFLSPATRQKKNAKKLSLSAELSRDKRRMLNDDQLVDKLLPPLSDQVYSMFPQLAFAPKDPKQLRSYTTTPYHHTQFSQAHRCFHKVNTKEQLDRVKRIKAMDKEKLIKVKQRPLSPGLSEVGSLRPVSSMEMEEASLAASLIFRSTGIASPVASFGFGSTTSSLPRLNDVPLNGEVGDETAAAKKKRSKKTDMSPKSEVPLPKELLQHLKQVEKTAYTTHHQHWCQLCQANATGRFHRTEERLRQHETDDRAAIADNETRTRERLRGMYYKKHYSYKCHATELQAKRNKEALLQRIAMDLVATMQMEEHTRFEITQEWVEFGKCLLRYNRRRQREISEILATRQMKSEKDALELEARRATYREQLAKDAKRIFASASLKLHRLEAEMRCELESDERRDMGKLFYQARDSWLHLLQQSRNKFEQICQYDRFKVEEACSIQREKSDGEERQARTALKQQYGAYLAKSRYMHCELKLQETVENEGTLRERMVKGGVITHATFLVGHWQKLETAMRLALTKLYQLELPRSPLASAEELLSNQETMTPPVSARPKKGRGRRPSVRPSAASTI